MFYDAHNDARRSMAKGLEPNKCGLLSGGKNVYELVSSFYKGFNETVSF